MQTIRVSDKVKNNRYIAYVAHVLQDKVLEQRDFFFKDDRAILQIQATEPRMRVLKEKILEKIAEVISIGYKYEFLKQNLKIVGLNQEDIEILLAFIIAADLPEERRYLIACLKEMDEHTIDGFYKFRLNELRKKWQRVVECIPSYFSKEQLVDFAEYLFKDRKGIVKISKNRVYDMRNCCIRRHMLIDSNDYELNRMREIILSCAGRVECLDELSTKQENFLKSYYVDRVKFK